MFNELPYKMSENELKKILEKYHKTKKDEYKNKIIVHNLRLITKIIYTNFKNLEYDKEDLFMIGTIGLIKAVENYDLNKKYAFSTFATACIKNEILMFLRKEKRLLNIINYNELINYNENSDYDYKLVDYDSFFEENLCNRIFYEQLCKKIEEFSPKEQEILKLYFGIDTKPMQQKQIASKYNVSNARINKKIKDCIEKLRNDEDIQIYNYSFKNKTKKVKK